MSESAYELAIALTILAALRLLDAPSRLRAAVLGAAIGLSALARAEALLLVLLLGLPLALRLERERLLAFALVCAGAAAVVLPWSARNLAAFDGVVLVSTNDGSVTPGANCASAYGPCAGPGTWAARFAPRPGPAERRTRTRSSRRCATGRCPRGWPG